MLEPNKIYLGDCLQVMKDIPDGSIDAIVTDPPYGTIACKWDNVIPFEPMWEQLKRIIKPNGAIVLFGNQPFTSALIMSNSKMFKYEWVWEKNLKTDNLNARKKPMGGHENILVFSEKLGGTYNPQKRKRTTEVRSGNQRNSTTSVYGKQRKYYNDRQSDWINPDTVLKDIKCVHSSTGKVHPTQKPVALMEYLIRTYTNEGETVLDFCIGSGTTAVACINTGRNFIGIEKEEKYVDIANKRIKDTLEQQTTATIPNACGHLHGRHCVLGMEHCIRRASDYHTDWRAAWRH